MASISKLAVIISGQTAPLEAAMKKAESKVSAFKHSFKEGAMLGAGVIGIDKLEQAMKKALADNEDLAEAAEKAEKSFGKILLRITGIQAALPAVSRLLAGMSDHIESGGLANDWQVFKEQAMSIALRTTLPADDVMRRLDIMRDEYEETVRIEKRQQYLIERDKERLKLAKEREEVVADELKAMASSLGSKLDTLDPSRELKKYEALKKQSKDPYIVAEIEFKKMQIDKLEEEKKAQDELNKLREEAAKITEEYLNPAEKLAAKQAELNKHMMAGTITSETYARALQQVPPVFKDLEDIQKEISKLENGEHFNRLEELRKGGATAAMIEQVDTEQEKLDILKKELELREEAKKAIEDQIPEAEKLYEQYEKARKAYLGGKLDKAGFDAIFKKYRDSAKNEGKPDSLLAGALAGGDAYSAIAQAQAASKTVDPIDLQKKQLDENKKQTELQKKLLDKQSNVTPVFLKPMSIRGGTS